ncbi:hypothetical protein ZWY2020_017058 [Hordeum vulgare]|nr:hypothetical protein ZWY2020_017058 [Hordeum vulgare]
MDDAAAVASEKGRREEPPEAMEDAAAASSSSQKRRRDEPESEARRDGGSGEDAGLDLVSELSMDLRGVILSRLANNKAAARTAILSSAWRYIWRSTPLNLAVDDDLAGHERNRITSVSEILASHRGPVRRLSLKTIRLGRNRYARFDGWFRSRVLDGLEELQFYGDGMPPRLLPLRPLPLPPSALRFAPTLHAASIGGCDFPEISALIFPELKRLKLYDVCISEADLRRLHCA